MSLMPPTVTAMVPAPTMCEPSRILRLSPAHRIRSRPADRQGHRRLHGRSEFGLVYVAWFPGFSTRGLAPRWDRQPGASDGGRRGQTTRLTRIALTTPYHRGPRLLPETGLRCRGDNRLRTA